MEFEKFITKALKLGFAGKEKPEKISRRGFQMKRVHYVEHEDRLAGSFYHDEWTDSRLGGGQELVHFITYEEKRIGEEDWETRLYAGGTVSDEELEKLGIKPKDVGKFLTDQINRQGEKTRLFADCEPESEGDWKYSYKIIEKIPEIELTVGKESIQYKDNLVFVHYFLFSPIK